MPGESAGTSHKCPNVARRVDVNGRSLTQSGRSEAKSLDDDEASHRIHGAMARSPSFEKRSVRALGPHGQPGSMDRGKKSAGRAIECESTILPGRLLTEPGEPLNEAPH